MALLATQTSSINATIMTFSAVAASDTISNDGKTAVIYNNGSGGNLTVDVTVAGTPGGLSMATITTATIANGEIASVGPFDPTLVSNSSGLVTLTPSTTSSVTAAVLRI